SSGQFSSEWSSRSSLCRTTSNRDQLTSAMRLKATNQNRVGRGAITWALSTPSPRPFPLGRGRTSRQSSCGFTLIELLLVLVILGILAAIVVPKFSNRGEQARQTAAKTQIAAFSTALSAFEVDNGYYPRGKDGLQALIQKPNDEQNWRGPYL